MKIKYLTKNPNQTKKIGRTLAKEILIPPQAISGGRKNALVLGLEGDLGGGKTTFLQGFAQGLGIRERILSPTFVLMKKFQIPRPRRARLAQFHWAANPKFQTFYHVDCYRIQKPKEILDLGFKEIISNSKNLVVVEWADRIREILPKNAIWIKFEFINKEKRQIVIKNFRPLKKWSGLC